MRACRRVHTSHVHHHHHHLHLDESLDTDLDDLQDEEDLDDEDEEEDDDEDDEDDDEEEMDYKMVFVVNRSLSLTPGVMTLLVSKATSGLYRKINSQVFLFSLTKLVFCNIEVVPYFLNFKLPEYFAFRNNDFDFGCCKV